MLVLSIRTDKPEAEIGLLEDGEQLAYRTWHAHRELAETIHTRLAELLAENGQTWQDIGGIVCFEGPGSFTGLRIGFSVANALAYGLHVPIAAAGGDDWMQTAIVRLHTAKSGSPAMPVYGAAPHTT